MCNMASILIVISCLIVSQILETKSENNFVTVACQKSDLVVQYGTSTLLDCEVKTDQSDVKIEIVTWKKDGKTVLSFIDKKINPREPRYTFAKSSWDGSNMNVSLLITNTAVSDAGEYHCDVVTDSGLAETKVQLTVKSNYNEPMINSSPKKITSDKDFTLTCETHGGYPKGDLRWVVNGEAWKKNPPVEVNKDANDLFSLSSKLSFGPNSVFRKFDCEVYNNNGVKEGQATFNYTPQDQIKGSGAEGPPVTQIVAPVVVIGSLIVGLLAAILLCRRRNQHAPPTYSEEDVQMYKEVP